MLKILASQVHHATQQPHSRAYYRVNAVRKLTAQVRGAHFYIMHARARTSDCAARLITTPFALLALLLSHTHPFAHPLPLPLWTFLQEPDKSLRRGNFFSKSFSKLTSGTSPSDVEVGMRHQLGTAASVSRQLSGGVAASVLGFASKAYHVIEGGGSITVQVTRSGATDSQLTVEYATQDLTATAGSDYVAVTNGTLTFARGESAQNITIKVLDDDVVEADEQFLIKLLKTSSPDTATISPDLATTTITIVNDDFPGTFVFPVEDFHIKEGEHLVSIEVDRVRGCSGAVSLQYKTKDGSALAGHNYTATSGTLSWAHGDVKPQTVTITITDDELLQGAQHFDLVLSDATGGAVFDEKTDGRKEASFARVTIEDDEKIVSMAERAIEFFGLSHQQARLGTSSYKEQFAAAVKIDLDKDSKPSAATVAFTWTVHVLALPWKVLVACVPPTIFCGGWLCFWCSMG